MNVGRRPFPALVAVALLGLLAACATPFEARVQSFQSMPPAQGQTFLIKPADAKRQGSLEFASYAGLVAAELQRLGYRQATGTAADLNVLVDFGSGPGRERLATRSGLGSAWGPGWGPGWGWYGRGFYGRPGYWGSFYDPFWGSSWSQPEVYSFTVWPAYLEVDIQRANDNVALFEGRAETTTRLNNLPSTMPRLVAALFTDFPGEPARSKVVRVPTR